MSNLNLNAKANIINMEVNDSLLKHLATLIICSYDDMKTIYTYLNDNDIPVKSRYITVFANNPHHVLKVINEFKNNGELNKLKENPLLLNSMKSLDNNLEIQMDDKLNTGLESFDPLSLILNSNFDDTLDDDMAIRVNRLYEIASKVVSSIYGADDLDTNIKNNIKKLVLSGFGDDGYVVYSSLIYNKNLSDEEENLIHELIARELEQGLSAGRR